MKSILEQALVHLLNNEDERAEELLHQFVIESARSIHESLREGDEIDLDETAGEQLFTEADLADAEVETAEDNLGDDLGQEAPELGGAADLADDTLDADAGLDGEADLAAEPVDGDVDAEIEEFEAELADLQAKFDALLADIEGGDETAVADEDTAALDAEVADVADAGADEAAVEVDAAPAEEIGDEDLVKEAEENEFDDITESIVDELQKITTPNEEGKGANGEQLLHNKQSLKFNKPDGKPVMTKGPTHKGFARETAPGSETLKGGSTKSDTSVRNVRTNADSGNSSVSKEGDKGASLNKAPAPNNKSVVTKPVGKK